MCKAATKYCICRFLRQVETGWYVKQRNAEAWYCRGRLVPWSPSTSIGATSMVGSIDKRVAEKSPRRHNGPHRPCQLEIFYATHHRFYEACVLRAGSTISRNV